jgi:hypothetical protein
VPVKFILQLLTAELKMHCCLSLASDLLECAEPDENFYRNFITFDITWVYSYGLEITMIGTVGNIFNTMTKVNAPR